MSVTEGLLGRASAEEYASWFRALADPSRVQILQYLARAAAPLSVGEIVAAVGLAQSTVSQHLRVLAEVRFVLVEADGNARRYRVNERCQAAFTTAADVVLGRPGAASPGGAGSVRAVSVRPMTPDDAASVLRIYQAGLDGGDASFETAAPSWEDFDAAKLPAHRFVAVDTDGSRSGSPSDSSAAVVGWVAAVAVSDRCVYAGVVEHSVYVDPIARGRGVGRALVEMLIASTEAAGIWTIQSGIFPENAASLALHHGLGFRTVGVRERLGRHGARGGAWRDVALLERRSPVVR